MTWADLYREDEQCGAHNTFHGYVCQRAAGHDGWHIEFRDNSTVAWGA